MRYQDDGIKALAGADGIAITRIAGRARHIRLWQLELRPDKVNWLKSTILIFGNGPRELLAEDALNVG